MGSAVDPPAIDEPRAGKAAGAAAEEAAVDDEGSISIASSSSLWLTVDSTPGPSSFSSS